MTIIKIYLTKIQFFNSRSQTDAILEKKFGRNSAADYPMFAKFCMNPRVTMVECENYRTLKIEDGRLPPS